MAISDAVDLTRISRVVGYKITKGNFNEVTPNLPQRIAVLAEANTANQGTLDLTPVEIINVKQAADLYGYGSPLYNIMRILKPSTGGGVGGIPVIAYPQAVAAAAAAATFDITPTGTATGNATHTVLVSGREGVDGQRYDFNIVTGDNVAAITAKITDIVNGVLASTVTATDNTTKATFEAKWKGLTSNSINVEILTNDKPFGISYAVVGVVAGSATPAVTTALNLFGSDWNTIVVNSYGKVASVLTELEDFNGIPDPDTPTGRYASIVVKPFLALFGCVDGTNFQNTMSSRKTQVTNTMCPAPLSRGLEMEAAANMAVLFANQSNTNPHLDVAGKSYPDMPTSTAWATTEMATYAERDFLVKNGVTTVDYVQERFQVQDFITSYRPDGEEPPQFRYCRNINIDLNVFFGYHLLEEIHVVDHAIAEDTDVVTVGNVVKPKQWKSVIRNYAKELGERGLIADVSFMQDSITAGLSISNPDRLETFFRYKRSGFARVLSTTAQAGFNFGTLQQ